MAEASPASSDPVNPGTVDTQGQTTAASTPATSTDAPAASSTATEGDKPKSMLDAVNAALEPKTEDASPASQADPKPATSDGADGKEGKSEDELSDDPTDEELAQASERTQKRMKKLLSQRNTARGEIDKLKPDAETGRMITEYVQKANLNSDEVNTGFEIMRLIKADPFAALEKLTPYVIALQQATGQILPQDLQQAIDEGRITEAYAREVATNRAKATNSTQALQQTQQQTEQERQQRAHTEHVDRVSKAASAYENTWKATDPEYKLKAEDVHTQVELQIRRNGFPKTEAEAVETIKTARAAVEKKLGTLRPAVKPMQSISGGGSSPQSKAPLKTMLDVVNRHSAV